MTLKKLAAGVLIAGSCLLATSPVASAAVTAPAASPDGTIVIARWETITRVSTNLSVCTALGQKYVRQNGASGYYCTPNYFEPHWWDLNVEYR